MAPFEDTCGLQAVKLHSTFQLLVIYVYILSHLPGICWLHMEFSMH